MERRGKCAALSARMPRSIVDLKLGVSGEMRWGMEEERDRRWKEGIIHIETKEVEMPAVGDLAWMPWTHSVCRRLR